MSINPDNVIRALRQENGKLRDENDLLRERLRQIEEHLCLSTPSEFLAKELSRSQSIVLNVLMKHTLPSWDMFCLSLYGEVRDRGNKECVDVFMCQLRKKLKPLGIQIITKWGQGFYMPQSSKEIVRMLA